VSLHPQLGALDLIILQLEAPLGRGLRRDVRQQHDAV